MSEEPISAREFNTAMEGLRNSMRDGFDSISNRMAGIEKELSLFDSFRMAQSERNGETKAKLEQQEHDLSGAKKTITGEITALKVEQGNTAKMAIAALGSLVLLLAGWLFSIFKR